MGLYFLITLFFFFFFLKIQLLTFASFPAWLANSNSTCGFPCLKPSLTVSSECILYDNIEFLLGYHVVCFHNTVGHCDRS